MSLAKIIAPVTGTPRDNVVIRTAFAAAAPFNAHVRTVFVHTDPRLSVPYAGVPISPEVVQSIIDANEEMLRAGAKSAKVALATAADEGRVRIVAQPERGDGVTASFVERTGFFADMIEQAALLADLVIFPPLSHGDNPEVHEGFVRVLTRVERPVLLAAEQAAVTLGKKIALAWDGGMAAARAVSAALPYLEKAQSVDIVSVQRSAAGQCRIEEAKAYLALHGVSSITSTIDPAGRAVADVLMEAASGKGCDMLVMGGYGHNRLAETVFGGVTQRIASHPKLPVLMVH